MKHKKIIFTLFLISNLLSITACSYISEQLGMNRRAPDEFAVITRAPLQIPSNLNELTSLPAPQLGMARPQEMDTRNLAKQAIGVTPSEINTTSAAEAGLLARVGKSDQNIRATVDQEAVNTTEQRPVAKRLLNIGDDKPAARILDPKAEKERIKAKSTIETPSKLD
jgi:hypothetical protein